MYVIIIETGGNDSCLRSQSVFIHALLNNKNRLNSMMFEVFTAVNSQVKFRGPFCMDL